MDEQEVIRQIVAGRTERFRELVQRYQDSVFRFTRSFVSDVHECEDIAQDVFLLALSNLSSYDASRSKFSTWLFTITRNKCLNSIRRRRPRVSNAAVDFAVRERVGGHAPEVDAASREFFQQLDRALATLPTPQRTAFVLAEIEGLPYAEVARIEETKLGTVKSRIARAKQHLRSVLKCQVEPR